MKLKLKRIALTDIVIFIIMTALVSITLYPFIFIASSSISNPTLVVQNKISILPKGLTLLNYKYVFSNDSILVAYWNTIKYAMLGTIINLLLTLMTAYPLSRKRFTGRRLFMKLITFTMLFNGGLIPTFLVVRELGLVNTIWAIVLLGAINTWNLIITRTFLEGIPVSLEEAAIIDGCNDIEVLFRIFLPLSMPLIATITLFYVVAHWNSFMVPLIYLNEKNKYPLQVFLRNLLIVGSMSDYMGNQSSSSEGSVVSQSIKYTTIIVSTLPMIAVYPFFQKYFIKGALIGAVKG